MICFLQTCSFWLVKTLTNGLEWCGLLWCFYQLFGLSFWRHPFQGSQNFKILGSPSGRYSSDFGSPKISWTSPNKKDHKCQSKTFLIHKYQGKILLFTGNVPSNFVSCWAKLFSIGWIFRAPEQKHSLYQTFTAHTQKSV